MRQTWPTQQAELRSLVERFPRCVAVVDLDAIAANIWAVRQLVGARTQVMAVVKANAYGHGAVPVAITALQAGAGALAVACVDEGVELRRAGITAPILLLGATPPEEMRRVVEQRLTPTICDEATGQAVQAAAASLGRTSYGVHVKVDTGLHRFGVEAAEAVDFVTRLQHSPRLHVEGLYTHFSSAEEVAGECTNTEYDRFLCVVEQLKARGIRPRLHAANSAATLRYPGLRLEMVRVGIALYGLAEPPPGGLTLSQRPALQVHSRISRLLSLAPGDGVGYGRTYIASEPRQAALVGIGYGDGYPRLLGNRAEVLVAGQRVPVIGRVSMDQIVIDITTVPDATVGAPVTIIGRQAAAQIGADQLAAWTDTIAYEIVTGLAPRLPRAYQLGGQLVAVTDLLGDRAILPSGATLFHWLADTQADRLVAP